MSGLETWALWKRFCLLLNSGIELLKVEIWWSDCGPRFPPTPPKLHRPNKPFGGAAAAFHLHEWDKNSSDSSASSDSGSSSGRFAARHGVTWYAKSLLIGPKCGAHRSASFRVYLARSAYTNAHLEKEILKKKTLGWLGLIVRYTIAGALSAGFFLLGLWKFLTSESIGVRHRLGPEFLGSIELCVFVVKRVVALVLVIYVFLFFPSSSSSSSVFNCSSSFSLIVLRTPLCFPRPFWFLIASKPRWLRPDGIHHFSYVEANLDARPRPRKLRSALEGSKDPLDGS